MKNALLVPVLVLALARAGSGQAERPGAPPVSGSRLVVVVSVDQMRYDYLVRFKSLFQGGLKTLIDRGAVFSNARYRHANCETGPGHSVILSGRNAWQSGIVANSWFDLSLGRTVNVVDDPTVRPVGGEGRGASPANFIGFTLGDMLKKASPDAKVVGVAMKDRAAILMAGPRGDAAYWYEQATGRFITSTYYTKTAPPGSTPSTPAASPIPGRARPGPGCWTTRVSISSMQARTTSPTRRIRRTPRFPTRFPPARRRSTTASDARPSWTS